jgi:translation initiation factor 1 (eIF-1/SUI1)
VPLLSKKCPGSCTLHDSGTGGVKKIEVKVQGQHIDLITDILTKKFKIPSKYIESVNMIESKMKKM